MSDLVDVTLSLSAQCNAVADQRDAALEALRLFMALDKTFWTTPMEVVDDMAKEGCIVSIAVAAARRVFGEKRVLN